MDFDRKQMMGTRAIRLMVTISAVLIAQTVALAPAVRADGAGSDASPRAVGDRRAPTAPSPLVARPVKLAVAQAASHAAARGVTAYISVVDRATGERLAETPNAAQQVQSESIMKLFIAAYYLASYGGYRATPAALKRRLAFMLEYSDDRAASSLFRARIIPTMARRYGLTATTNAPRIVGRWGAAQISASDMTTFLAKVAADRLVGPWILAVMARTSAYGSDGFDQDFGLNALTGEHGSKQGWGDDTAFGPRRMGIHSVGYTDRFFVAILQLSTQTAEVARGTSTFAAKLIARSRTTPLPDGLFVRFDGITYRIAGGAPIRVTSWASVGGVQPAVHLGSRLWGELPQYPADGTFIRTASSTFRVVGGVPTRVASWAEVGGVQPTTLVDPKAIVHAGAGGPWDHLKPVESS